MASPNSPINVEDDEELSVLNSSNVPTLNNDRAKTMKVLLNNNVSNAEYERAIFTLPHDHKIKLSGIQYVLMEPYRVKNAVKRAWWWDQGIELCRLTKGKSYLFSLI